MKRHIFRNSVIIESPTREFPTVFRCIRKLLYLFICSDRRCRGVLIMCRCFRRAVRRVLAGCRFLRRPILVGRVFRPSFRYLRILKQIESQQCKNKYGKKYSRQFKKMIDQTRSLSFPYLYTEIVLTVLNS